IRRMLPQLRSDRIVGGSFCSTDGFVDPYSAMTGFMAAAAEHGARLWRATEVTGIARDHLGISGVLTTKRPVATRIVVNAAGAWAAAIASMVGVDLPVEPLRLTLAAGFVPCFENLPVNPKRAWAGLYEMTPDHHCILGPVP